MKVLIVEPMKPCYVREISGLNDMQEIVGGHIEAIYPFKEQVAIIANEEGKILGLPFNRPLSDERGVPYDIGLRDVLPRRAGCGGLCFPDGRTDPTV